MGINVEQIVTRHTRRLGVVILLLSMPGGFGQVRRVADRKASGRLDDLARLPKNRVEEFAAPREVYEPERAVRKRNSSARALLAREPEPSPAGVATVTPGFGGFQALVDNFKVIPPDTEGAVCAAVRSDDAELAGPDSIADRSGARQLPITLNNFWSPLSPDAPFTDTFDPRILYDAAADRWIACASLNSNKPQAALLVAVSQTGDPGLGWNYFQTNFNDATTSTRPVWGDYPELGFNANWVVISANLFRVSTTGNSTYQHTNLYVFQKSDLYENGTGAHVTSARLGARPFASANCRRRLDRKLSPEVMAA